ANQNGSVDCQLTNDSDETAHFCITAKTADGREAACRVKRKFCGDVTEEGKRSVSKIGRSAKGQVRLPSSVTLPQTFV
ncbi:MAG: hypothetical protein II083_03865, partial [Ruminococcus sp.]|nr:hypothetical protein [Ruminococcus sp.]